VRSLGAATVNGAVTTFLGILPIAFSYYKYFVMYFFIQYVLILVVCLFQGVVVLPVVLSLIGEAVQVDPIKPKLKPPGTERLKLKCDDPLSNFGFKFNLRCYTSGPPRLSRRTARAPRRRGGGTPKRGSRTRSWGTRS
jgi:hypothetical protein